MDNFWLIFWCSFSVFQIWLILSIKFSEESILGGYSKSDSHYWAYSGGAKSHDATKKSVYERYHGRGSFEAAQNRNAILLILGLSIATIVALPYVFKLVPSIPYRFWTLKLYWSVFGAGISGVITGLIWGVIFWGVREFLAEHRSGCFLHVLCVGLVLLGPLVFALWGEYIPFSINWLWVPTVLVLPFLGVDNYFGKESAEQAERARKYQAQKEQEEAAKPYLFGLGLQMWVGQVIDKAIKAGVMNKPPTKVGGHYLDNMLKDISNTLSTGKLDAYISKDFLNTTEALLRGFINKDPIALDTESEHIKNHEYYSVIKQITGSTELVQAIQNVYFYAVNKQWREIHPDIVKALEKKS